MSQQVYRPRSKNTATIKVCLTCPHRRPCTRVSALSYLPDPPGYIPLGIAFPCPDGFVEPVLDSEVPGETWDTKEFNSYAYIEAEVTE